MLRRSDALFTAGACPTGGRRTVDDVLPPIENRDPGDETDED